MIWNNGIIQNKSLESYPASNEKGWLYEVLRIKQETPVFLFEHLERLWKTLEYTGVTTKYSQDYLGKEIFDLIRTMKIWEGNLRIQIDLNDESILMGPVPHHYPTPEDYENGVEAGLADLQRTNPGIKTWNISVRQAADKIIQKEKIFETILTSPEGFLLEGSRSNIFGLQNGTLITPPQDLILPGITRQIIIELAIQHHIPVLEKLIHHSELANYESFFITGTSPGILAVKNIGLISFTCQSNIYDLLRSSYDKKIQESITNTFLKMKSLYAK